MLFADRPEQCPLSLGQLPTSAPVGAWGWAKGLQTARFVGVIPALQRRHRECLGRVGIGRSEALLAQLAEGQRELTAVELTARERSNYLASKERDRFCMVFG